MRVWNIEQDRENGGRIVRTALPRFRARWITGDDLEEIAALPGPCWSDSGSGSGEDAIHVYGFVWSRGAPDQAAFEALMREAAREIDAWIAGRL
jgi:hypothetical protein